MTDKKCLDFAKKILSCIVFLVGGSLFCILFLVIAVFHMAASLIWELTEHLIRKIEGS